MKTKLRFLITSLSLLAAAVVLTAAAVAFTGYELPRWTVDNGGGHTSEGSYALQGTIGQYDTGRSSKGAYYLQGGFWAGPQSELLPTEFLIHLPLITR